MDVEPSSDPPVANSSDSHSADSGAETVDGAIERAEAGTQVDETHGLPEPGDTGDARRAEIHDHGAVRAGETDHGGDEPPFDPAVSHYQAKGTDS